MLDSQLAGHRDRLADMLVFSRENVPYYRETLPPDVGKMVSSGQRWQDMPMVTKQQVQSDWSSFLSDPSAIEDQSVDILYTSGSTGMPLRIVRSRSELRAQTKRLWAVRAQWHPGMMRWRWLNLYCRPESINMDSLELCDDGYLDLSFRALAACLERIDDYGPDGLYGPPTAAYRLAQCYRSAGRNTPTLKLIEVTGEQLYSHQRDLLESVFGCPVINHYGTREFWVLSFECPSRSMHAWTDDLLLEVVQDGRSVPPGEIGELVVTSLTNRLMPLIRYRVGDLVRMYSADCPCGNPRPILEPVIGRANSLIVTREKAIGGIALERAFASFIRQHKQTVLEFKVLQLDYDHLEIYLVLGEGVPRLALIRRLREVIQQVLPGMHCQFIFCSSIPHMSSGKTQVFVSHVAPDVHLPRESQH